jgi:putative Mg2+ transporter-C (MgtC) family protein
VLQGVVGGIGFLGAGAIIKSSGNVTGMTTAASVWIAGALGAGAGMGAYFVAVVATVLALFTLRLLPLVERNRGSEDPGTASRGTQDTQRDSDPKPTSV